jgi:hypothetical protein
MRDLSREIKGISTSSEDADRPSEEFPDDRPRAPRGVGAKPGRDPRRAGRAGQDALGPRLVAEAHARGFPAARRKAFVADGSASNWSVHQQHFSHYTPILDFTHAICYVYTAAMVGRTGRAAWNDYVRWAQWLWEGAVDQVIAAVAARAEELGRPSDGDETSPAAIVTKTLGYLQNQRSRMKYHEYRRLVSGQA